MLKWLTRIIPRKPKKQRISYTDPYFAGVTWPPEEFRKNIRPIFDAAPKFSRLARQDKTVVLFIGRSTRPLFDAAREINTSTRRSERAKRENIKYFVPPKKDFLDSLEGQGVAQLAAELKRKNIVSDRKQVYYLVDYVRSGSTAKIIERAIKTVNPQAEVRLISQKTPEFADVINISNLMPRPTTKNDGIPVTQTRSHPRITASYKQFQDALQDHVKNMK
ncbi:MAG TPA: hypothetical protein VFF13_01195 [archaeon]|nr:hypothetical protein [archaeon]